MLSRKVKDWWGIPAGFGGLGISLWLLSLGPNPVATTVYDVSSLGGRDIEVRYSEGTHRLDGISVGDFDSFGNPMTYGTLRGYDRDGDGRIESIKYTPHESQRDHSTLANLDLLNAHYRALIDEIEADLESPSRIIDAKGYESRL